MHWNNVLRMRGEGDVEATVGYATALHEMGQTPLARLVIEGAVRETPHDEQAQLWMALAAIEADLGQSAAQTVALESALEADPELAEGWVKLARQRRSAGDLSRALAHFERAATLDPRRMRAFDEAASIARELDLPLVEFRFLMGRVANEPVPCVTYMRAVTLSFHPRVTSQYKDVDALRQVWLEAAIEQDPQGQRAHLLLGVHHLDAGDATSADPLLTRAAELDPSDADALHALVRCLRATGQDSRASRVLDHAFSVVPENEHDRFRSLTVE